MKSIDIVIARTTRELADHETAWNQLVAASSQNLPMLTYAWISAYLDHRLRPDERWMVTLAYCGDRLVGVLPQLISPRALWRIPYVVSRMPRDEHTGALSPLVADDCAAYALHALLREAAKNHGRHVHIELERVPEYAPMLTFLDRRSLAFPHLRQVRGVGAYLPVPHDFVAYRRGLSRNFRNNLNKARNKFNAMSDTRVHFLVGADAGPSSLRRFMDVEGSGWKGQRGTAIAENPDLVAFYTTLVQRLGRAGWLEWHFLEAEGKTLAANLGVRVGHRLLLWKLGYQHEFRRCSPGSLLMEELVLRASQQGEGITEIDLMTDWEWYDRWQMRRRQYHDVFVYPTRPMQLSCYAARNLYMHLRRSRRLRRPVSFLREIARRS